MNVVLILNKKFQNDFRVMVNVSTGAIRNRIKKLIEEEKKQEAFDLLLREGEVIDYLPQGRKPQRKIDLVMVEDLL